MMTTMTRKALTVIILTSTILLPHNVEAQETTVPAGNQVSRLIQDLKGKDQGRASRAGQVLAKLGAVAVPALLEAFKDRRWDKRDRAIYVLGHCGTTARPHLYTILEGSSGLVQRQALSGIRQIGAYNYESFTRLRPYLKSPDETLRTLTETIFLEMETGQSLLTLLRANPKLRGSIVQGFMRLGSKSHDTLLSLLKSKSRSDRELATQVLARSGRSAQECLRRILKGSNRQAAHHALQLLISYGRESTLQWEDLNESLKSSNIEEHVLAITALESLEEPKELISEALEWRLKSSSPDIRSIAALVALRRSAIVHQRFLTILKSGLVSGQAKTKIFILSRLSPFLRNDIQFAPILLKLMNAADLEIRCSTLRCMSSYPLLFQDHLRTIFQSMLGERVSKVRRAQLELLSRLDLTALKDKRWLKVLEDKDPGVQGSTLYCLSKVGSLGPDAEKEVAKCLSSPSSVVKQNAIVVLTIWETEDLVILRRFIECLGDKNREIRSQAGQALLKRSAVARPIMRRALKTAPLREKSNLISLLGRLKDKPSQIAIESYLTSKDPRVRLSAVLAIAELKDPSVTATQQILMMAETDAVKSIRQISSQVRKHLGLEHTIRTRIAALIMDFQSTDAVRRYDALVELVKYRKRAVPALIESLTHKSAEVRYHSASALASLAEWASDAIPALSKSLKDPETKVREATRKALRKILKLNK